MPLHHIGDFYCLAQRQREANVARNDSVKESSLDWEALMSGPVDRGSDEQPETLIDRREAVGEGLTRLAKYTAPIMLAALMSSSASKKAAALIVS